MNVYIVKVYYQTGAYDERRDHVDILHVFRDKSKAAVKVAEYEKNPIVEDVFDDGEQVIGTYRYIKMKVE